MITKVLNLLHDGLYVMRSNTKILLLTVLVFLFSLLFVWVTQGFYVTAVNNTNTVEKQKIELIHTSLATSLSHVEHDTTKVIAELVGEFLNSDHTLEQVQILSIKNDLPELFYTSVATTPEISDSLLEIMRRLQISTSSVHIVVPASSNERVWQGVRKVETKEKTFYIFTVHTFGQLDSVMSSRWQNSYFGLTAIFLFMILLAYWIHRQTDWHKKFIDLRKRLDDQMLFSNMIAHEFRAPLTATKGYTSFLKESKDILEVEMKYVDIIKSSTDRLITLVNDFLEVARIQSGKMKIEKNLVDIRQVIIKVQENQNKEAKVKGLALTYNPGSKKIFVNTDKDRLTQVLINLLSNAIKYTHEGSIQLESKQVKNLVFITIKDTGVGISADNQEKLFTPFERFSETDRQETKGTGLGMYITKQLVHLLGGTIGVESIKGVGTRLTITIPID